MFGKKRGITSNVFLFLITLSTRLPRLQQISKCMPSWSSILKDVDASADVQRTLYHKRQEYFNTISSITGRNVIAYYSGWLKYPQAPNISINELDKNAFMEVVYGLDRSKGLDIILHTPGGELAATESIVTYLKRMFNNNIRAIIPQISMSAGTMMAMSCQSIIMGEQSSLGPIDPQLGGIACQAVLDEFKDAVKQISQEPSSLGLWQVIISKYDPTFLTACQNAITWSGKLATQWLTEVNPNINVKKVLDAFFNHRHSFSHAKHMSKGECKNAGLPIVDLENDQNLQDAVLSLHHCFMIFFDKFLVSKAVENQNGGSFIQQFQQNRR